MSAARQFATLGGVGRLWPGPGTWASAVVLPAALLGPAICLVLALVVAWLGLRAVRQVLAETRASDPSWIVVDEAAGMLLALAGLPPRLEIGPVLVAFLLFRLLDIAKPWPVSWADRQPGAPGVILDDLLAGAMTGAGLFGFELALPGVL